MRARTEKTVREAKSLRGNDFLESTFDELEADYFSQWASSATVIEREQTHARFIALRQLRDTLDARVAECLGDRDVTGTTKDGDSGERGNLDS